MNKIRLNRLLLAGLVTFFVWVLVEILVEQVIGRVIFGDFIDQQWLQTTNIRHWGVGNHVLNILIANRSFNIIIDLKNVDYISSAGWGVFLAKLKDIREHEGDLKLVNMTTNVYDMYKVLEFFWFIRYYTSIEAAIDDFDNKIPPMPQ